MVQYLIGYLLHGTRALDYLQFHRSLALHIHGEVNTFLLGRLTSLWTTLTLRLNSTAVNTAVTIFSIFTTVLVAVNWRVILNALIWMFWGLPRSLFLWPMSPSTRFAIIKRATELKVQTVVGVVHCLGFPRLQATGYAYCRWILRNQKYCSPRSLDTLVLSIDKGLDEITKPSLKTLLESVSEYIKYKHKSRYFAEFRRTLDRLSAVYETCDGHTSTLNYFKSLIYYRLALFYLDPDLLASQQYIELCKNLKLELADVEGTLLCEFHEIKIKAHSIAASKASIELCEALSMKLDDLYLRAREKYKMRVTPNSIGLLRGILAVNFQMTADIMKLRTDKEAYATRLSSLFDSLVSYNRIEGNQYYLIVSYYKFLCLLLDVGDLGKHSKVSVCEELTFQLRAISQGRAQTPDMVRDLKRVIRFSEGQRLKLPAVDGVLRALDILSSSASIAK